MAKKPLLQIKDIMAAVDCKDYDFHKKMLMSNVKV